MDKHIVDVIVVLCLAGGILANTAAISELKQEIKITKDK